MVFILAGVCSEQRWTLLTYRRPFCLISSTRPFCSLASAKTTTSQLFPRTERQRQSYTSSARLPAHGHYRPFSPLASSSISRAEKGGTSTFFFSLMNSQMSLPHDQNPPVIPLSTVRNTRLTRQHWARVVVKEQGDGPVKCLHAPPTLWPTPTRRESRYCTAIPSTAQKALLPRKKSVASLSSVELGVWVWPWPVHQ